MKKLLIGILLLGASQAMAQDKGGAAPMLASCCLGPRIGLEMNEGIPVEGMEIVNLFIPCIMPMKAFEKNGLEGCVWAGCAGPRVGMQLDVRKPRTKEKAMLYGQLIGAIIPGGSLISVAARVLVAMEAMEGKTMTEIETAEGLAK